MSHSENSLHEAQQRTVEPKVLRIRVGGTRVHSATTVQELSDNFRDCSGCYPKPKPSTDASEPNRRGLNAWNAIKGSVLGVFRWNMETSPKGPST